MKVKFDVGYFLYLAIYEPKIISSIIPLDMQRTHSEIITKPVLKGLRQMQITEC